MLRSGDTVTTKSNDKKKKQSGLNHLCSKQYSRVTSVFPVIIHNLLFKLFKKLHCLLSDALPLFSVDFWSLFISVKSCRSLY